MAVCVVTGGAGFIGSHLCETLLGRGDRVVCVDNLVTGKRENLGELEDHSRFSFQEMDVSREFAVEGPVDFIFHLASPASPVDYLKHPIETLKVGGPGTIRVLETAAEKKARFLLASTSEVYGDPQVHPQPESYWGNVNPVGYRGAYDEAKRYAEALTMAYRRVHGLETRIARIFNTYGPRMRLEDGRALPAFVSQALSGKPLSVYGDGSQTRSFCYVSDLVGGLIGLMESDEPDPVNLGNPQEVSILEFAKEVLELSGSSSEIEFQPLSEEYRDDPKQRRPDITRARTILGWEPKVPRRQGLEKTIEYFKNRMAAWQS